MRLPVCRKRILNTARPERFVTARRPASRTTAPRTIFRAGPARTTALILTRRLTLTFFGVTETPSFVRALNGCLIAHELCGGPLPRTTVRNTTSDAPQAAILRMVAPGRETIAPPRTSAAYPCGYWRAGITTSDRDPKPNGPLPSTR